MGGVLFCVLEWGIETYLRLVLHGTKNGQEEESLFLSGLSVTRGSGSSGISHSVVIISILEELKILEN
jgi:hypothetical protein